MPKMIEITAAEYDRLQDCIREDGMRIAALIEENKALHKEAAMRTSNDKLTFTKMDGEGDAE